jgi:sigma-B regulation protein RsbU (phosphoserine phosphatase)
MISRVPLKGRRKSGIVFSIATKLLVFFTGLSVISFVIVGVVAVINMDRIGSFAKESSDALGTTATRDSVSALEETGEAAIQQKAIDVADKIHIYLEGHPGPTAEELKNDPELARIAVEPIGQTGYTALYEKETGIMIFHPNPSMVNYDMHNLSEKLPSFWMVFHPSLRGTVSSGYYDWEDADGTIREKFMYMVPVEGTVYMVAATTYIDEFSQPAIVTKNEILAATAQATIQIDRQISNTQFTFRIIFAVLLLVITGLSFWLSRLITNPIKKLKMSSEIIGGGNLDYSVDVKTGDELEDLANSFNKMALDLKTHIEDLRRTTAENERVQKELDLARGIQRSFLPESPPIVPGFDLAALNTPALEVGGDFFDFIPVSLDQWGLVIADVSGKGFPAALFMALSRTMLRANALGNPTVLQTICRANNMIAQEGRANMFVTLFYGVLDPKSKTLTYVNAGHNPPFVTDREGGDIVILAAKGIALGIMSDMEFEEKEVTLREGDILLLYTDGVTEAVNRKGEMFGQHRLAKLVEDNQKRSAQEIIQIIEQTVLEYAEGLPQFDDLTLMAVKVI